MREAAAETVGKFSEYVVPDFLDLHEQIMPCLLLLLGFLTNPSYSRDVRYWALMALGSVESSAAKRITPYQEPILQALNNIIINPNLGPSELTVRGQALMCAG